MHKDNRPESWQPLLNTLKVVGSVPTNKGNGDARLDWIKPTLLRGYAELKDKQESENKSLAAFSPSRILGIEVSLDREALVAATKSGSRLTRAIRWLR